MLGEISVVSHSVVCHTESLCQWPLPDTCRIQLRIGRILATSHCFESRRRGLEVGSILGLITSMWVSKQTS
jgi:hypothetical protein